MKIIVLLLLLSLQLIYASEEWNSFKATHHKVYKNVKEENHRKQIFLKNLQRIEEHNQKYEQGIVSFSLGINKFADLTHEELFPPSNSKSKATPSGTAPAKSKFVPTKEVPESIDWRDYGVITPVADQVWCNSCWAFAIVATVEAHMGIYRGETVSLSQENLIDCVDPTFECTRSLMDREILEKTYQYIIDNGGIDTVASYLYDTDTSAGCRFDRASVGATIAGYGNITEADEEELKAVVGTIGPVTVAITTDFSFDLYFNGVYYNPDCLSVPAQFNHAVVIVGYGTENGTDFWWVKNSWGTWFGLDGYIKMARNHDNNCGIASIARYPIM